MSCTYSAFNLARLTGIVLMLVPALGCARREQPPPAPLSMQPAMQNPVGPVPGPDIALPLPANPYAHDKVALAEGHRLFARYNCSGCHGDHAGGGMGPSLRDEDWLYGGSDADIAATITQGRIGMPAWGTKLPQDQIWKLAAYIKSMRTPDEPEPPTP